MAAAFGCAFKDVRTALRCVIGGLGPAISVALAANASSANADVARATKQALRLPAIITSSSSNRDTASAALDQRALWV
jgi:hypothetical protein